MGSTCRVVEVGSTRRVVERVAERVAERVVERVAERVVEHVVEHVPGRFECTDDRLVDDRVELTGAYPGPSSRSAPSGYRSSGSDRSSMERTIDRQ
ncbi:MAG: hypothetical protein AAGF11_39030 [Myxococcota bacterium]